MTLDATTPTINKTYLCESGTDMIYIEAPDMEHAKINASAVNATVVLELLTY